MATPRFKDWLIALRPHTLPASIAPVCVGLALAIRNDVFEIPTAISAMFVAMFLQLAVNLANDYFDYQSGVDDSDSPGFERACASGRINPSTVKFTMYVMMILSVLPGLYLVSQGGFPLIVAGLLSLLATIGYSGGPFPYASYGLGDLMVFVFFGLVATSGTYYVQFCASTIDYVPFYLPADFLSLTNVVIAIPPGCLSTAILVINNLRDFESDRDAGKYTLAVLLGRTGSKIEYLILMVLAYSVPVYFYLGNFTVWILLPLLTVPLSLTLALSVLWDPDPDIMNQRLSQTAQLLLSHSLLFGAGIILS
jgi:1,4-dihydroxy-2-naphthoate octaprenyltransferase